MDNAYSVRSLPRLIGMMRLASPSLPVGAFSYSQGLETAIEKNIVLDLNTTQQWLESILRNSFSYFELPIIKEMMRAWANKDIEKISDLNRKYLITRETHELRAETRSMGNALVAIAKNDLSVEKTSIESLLKISDICYPTVYACMAHELKLDVSEALAGYAWSWAENQVMAAIKTIPLGQTAGQKILSALSVIMADAVETALAVEESEWSNFCPVLAIMSSQHETQYSRLFRS
jgi:urease accessory protein